MSTKHRTRIEPWGMWHFQPKCSCGWFGKQRTEVELAIHDADRHERHPEEPATAPAEGVAP